MIKMNYDISIEVNVENHMDVIKENKGRIKELLARLDPSAESKVEDAIKAEIHASLLKELPEEVEPILKQKLRDKGIKSSVSVQLK